MTQPSILTWLLECEHPWVRLGALTHLADMTEDSPEVAAARRETMQHPAVKTLLDECLTWPEEPMKNHKSAKHPLYRIVMVSELGLGRENEPVEAIIDAFLSYQDDSGAFQSLIMIPTVFGGSGDAGWEWMLCDAPHILYALCNFGMSGDERVIRAADHLASQVRDSGWPCGSSIPKMKGPGRRAHPCPYATLIALKALSMLPAYRDSEACHLGAEMLLGHWENRGKIKYFLFGIGTDFSRLKYPLVWYDILHAVEVLSRFEWTRDDRRFREMYDLVLSKADDSGRYTPESVWMAYKGFDFAQKKEPSPTLTLLVEGIRRRMEID